MLGREGYFHALDAKTGALLWKASLGSQIVNGPIACEVDGKQYVATISALSLCIFFARVERFIGAGRRLPISR